MDIEQGRISGISPEIAIGHQQEVIARTHLLVLALVFLFVLFGMLPPSFVMWFFLAILATMMWQRWRTNPESGDYQQRQLLFLLASHGQVDLVNMGLTLVHRDFTDEDYERLLALDHQTNSTPQRPVSDDHISQLPLYKIKVIEDENTPITPVELCDQERLYQYKQQAQFSSKYASCSICLEDFGDKEQVMMMPCQHSFHPKCIVPWIKLRGEGAPCPMCKREIFIEKSESSGTNHNQNQDVEIIEESQDSLV